MNSEQLSACRSVVRALNSHFCIDGLQKKMLSPKALKWSDSPVVNKKDAKLMFYHTLQL